MWGGGQETRQNDGSDWIYVGMCFFYPNTFQMFLNECYFGNWGGRFLPVAPYSCTPLLKKMDPECLCSSMERRETVTCPQSDFAREVPCPKVDSEAGKEEQKVAGRTRGLRQGEDYGEPGA